MSRLNRLERGGRVLIDLVGSMRPWADVQAEIEQIEGNGTVYLGGDGLRPYFVLLEHDSVEVVSVENLKLPAPPLIQEIISGRHGEPATVRNRDGLAFRSLPRTAQLDVRLSVPNVLLMSMNNAKRYSSARLNLGVARLAQWLRFTNSATVAILESTVSDAPDTDFVGALPRTRADILGISANFGQWSHLEAVMSALRPEHARFVVLGNVLPAFAVEGVLDMIETAGFEGAIANSLGERPLEALCRRIDSPESWHEIPGVVTRRSSRSPRSRLVVAPPTLVCPDEDMVASVAARGGLVSFETSFGCQYGKCTFCPRSHRGEGWMRGDVQLAEAIIRRLSTRVETLSLVDEDFFGSEGLEDPPPKSTGAQSIARACRTAGLSYEIYTRVEQLFDRRRSRSWNTGRAEMLAREASAWSRVFVGVESGVDSQLRRYGKGQTVGQITDALRVGSYLGVVLEFGFITFDPLLTPKELIENIRFLASTTVLSDARGVDLESRVRAVGDYYSGGSLPTAGIPLYERVSYMATELEVLRGGRYYAMLRSRHPELLDGLYDANFSRYGTHYRDAAIKQIADWCRAWTEAAFPAIYRARVEARNGGRGSAEASRLVSGYRAVTFSLLVDLYRRLVPGAGMQSLSDLPSLVPGEAVAPEELLKLAGVRVFGDQITFGLEAMHRRRQS